MSAVTLASYVYNKLSGSGPLKISSINDMSNQSRNTSPNPKLTAVWRSKTKSIEDVNPSPFKEDGSLLRLLRTKSMPSIILERGSPTKYPVMSSSSISPMDASLNQSTSSSISSPITSRHLNPRRDLDTYDYIDSSTNTSITSPPLSPIENSTNSKVKLQRSASDGHMLRRRKHQLRDRTFDIPIASLPSVKSLRLRFQRDSGSTDKQLPAHNANKATQDIPQIMENNDEEPKKASQSKKLVRHESLGKWEQHITESTPGALEIHSPTKSIKNILKQFETATQSINDDEVLIDMTVRRSRSFNRTIQNKASLEHQESQEDAKAEVIITDSTDRTSNKHDLNRQRSKSVPVSSGTKRMSVANIKTSVKDLRMQFEKQQDVEKPFMFKARSHFDDEARSVAAARRKEMNVAEEKTGKRKETRINCDKLEKEKQVQHIENDVNKSIKEKEVADINSINHIPFRAQSIDYIDHVKKSEEKDWTEEIRQTPKSPSVKNLRKQFEESCAQPSVKVVKKTVPLHRQETIQLVLESNAELKVSDYKTVTPKDKDQRETVAEVVPSPLSVKNLLQQFEPQSPTTNFEDEVNGMFMLESREKADTVMVKGDESMINMINKFDTRTESKDEDSEEEFYDESSINSFDAEGSMDYEKRKFSLEKLRRPLLERNISKESSSSDGSSSDDEKEIASQDNETEIFNRHANKLCEQREESERREKAVQELERKQREQVEKEMKEREKLERDRIEIENLEREEKERKEREKADQELLARKLAEEESIAINKTKLEKLALEKAEQERIALEKAELDKIAWEQAEQKRIALEKAELEKIAWEKAEQACISFEKIELEKVEREKAEHERIQKEMEEQERLNKEQANTERMDKGREEEQKEQERKQQEQIERERADQEEKERTEREEKEREKAEKEKKEREKEEKEKAENDRKEQERLANERTEKEQREREKEEQKALEMELQHKKRAEKERLDREKETSELQKEQRVGDLVDKFTTIEAAEKGDSRLRNDSVMSEDSKSEIPQSELKVGQLIEKFVNIREQDMEEKHPEPFIENFVKERRDSDVTLLINRFTNVKRRDSSSSHSSEDGSTDSSSNKKNKNAPPIPKVKTKTIPGKVRNLNADELRFFNQEGADATKSFVRSQNLRGKKNEPPRFNTRGGSVRVKSSEPHPLADKQNAGSTKAIPKFCRQLRPDELRFFAMTNNNEHPMKKTNNRKESDTNQDFRLSSQGDREERQLNGISGDDQNYSRNHGSDSDSDSDTSFLREEEEISDEALMLPEYEFSLNTTPYCDDTENEDDEAHCSSLTTMDSELKDNTTVESHKDIQQLFVPIANTGGSLGNEPRSFLLDEQTYGHEEGVLSKETDYDIFSKTQLCAELQDTYPNQNKTSTPISTIVTKKETLQPRDSGEEDFSDQKESSSDEGTDSNIGLMDQAIFHDRNHSPVHPEVITFNENDKLINLDDDYGGGSKKTTGQSSLQNSLKCIDDVAIPLNEQDEAENYEMTEGDTTEVPYSTEEDDDLDGNAIRPIEDYYLPIDENKEYLSEKDFAIFCFLVAGLSTVMYFIYDYFV